MGHTLCLCHHWSPRVPPNAGQSAQPRGSAWQAGGSASTGPVPSGFPGRPPLSLPPLKPSTPAGSRPLRSAGSRASGISTEGSQPCVSPTLPSQHTSPPKSLRIEEKHPRHRTGPQLTSGPYSCLGGTFTPPRRTQEPRGYQDMGCLQATRATDPSTNQWAKKGLCPKPAFLSLSAQNSDLGGSWLRFRGPQP